MLNNLIRSQATRRWRTNNDIATLLILPGTAPARVLLHSRFRSANEGTTVEALQLASKVSWNRGLHRVFALACVLWLLFVFIGLPLMTSHQRVEFASTMMSFNL